MVELWLQNGSANLIVRAKPAMQLIYTAVKLLIVGMVFVLLVLGFFLVVSVSVSVIIPIWMFSENSA